MAGAKKVRSNRAPKRSRATLLARYHELIDLELLNQLNEAGQTELSGLRETFEVETEAAQIMLMEQISRDRELLLQSMAELSAFVKRVSQDAGGRRK